MKIYKIKTAKGFLAGIMAVYLMSLPLHAAKREIADKDITSAVNTELMHDNSLSANNISVSTGKGVVTLKGTVNNLLTKDRAIAIAEATVGVSAIVDLIEVDPGTIRGDKELRVAVENAWVNDPVADSYELKAVADDGIITIKGTVDSHAEREVSATVAKGVKGVKGIKNEVKVEYGTERSDLEIQKEIKARFKNDIRIDDYLVGVKVYNGKVELSGTVGSLQEKRQARNDAWVAGVISVDASGLEVKSWARGELRRKETYVTQTDEEIKKAVEASFSYDPRIYSFLPDVEVDDGTVTLMGTVDNLRSKRAAEEDARNTLGVWRVKNHLKVRTTTPDNDKLEQLVESVLLSNPYVELYELQVDAYDGAVYLSGEVETSFEKNQAEQVAEGVKGVVDVVNNIKADNIWIPKSDFEITADVKDQLWSTPFVDEDDVSVVVDNGIVTLSGTVGSWTERDEAEKNAFQAGAKDVRNDLQVNYQYYGPSSPDN